MLQSTSQDETPDTAEAWMARLLSPDCDADERAAFKRWRAADPERMLAFAEVEHLHESVAELADDPLLRAAARAALRNKTPAHRRPLAWALSAAAGLVAIIGLALHFHQAGAPGENAAGTAYASTTSLRTIQLEDGTRVQLDAASSITVYFDRRQRLVDLDHGRAEFTIAADPDRPFEVHAGDTVIHDIGTIFQVSRDARQVSVGLLEGLVQVSGTHDGKAWQRDLQPAQQMNIYADGTTSPTQPLDVAAARGWPQGQLVFHQRRLDELLVEANRYSPVKLRLGDASLASLKVSGSIHAGDTDTLLKALEQGWQLQATKGVPDELILRRDPDKLN